MLIFLVWIFIQYWLYKGTVKPVLTESPRTFKKHAGTLHLIPLTATCNAFSVRHFSEKKTRYDFSSKFTKSSFDHRLKLGIPNAVNKRFKKMWSTIWDFFNESSHWLYWYRVQTSLISLSWLDSIQLSRHLYCKQICKLIYICQNRSSSEKLTFGIYLQDCQGSALFC